jgi:hypothetical protein
VPSDSPNKTPPLLAVLVALTLVAYAGWAKPYYNWDLLPYTAVALRLGGVPEDSLHARTYAAAREGLAEPIYQMLVEAGEYRSAVAADAEVFRQQLPFYAAKPAFPVLLAAATRLGLHPIRAAALVPRLVYLILAAAVVVWAVAAFGSTVGPLVGLAVAGLPFVIDLARLATPDGLSTCFIVTSLVLLLERRASVWALAVATAAVLVRPDNVIWIGIVAGSLALQERRYRVHAVAALAFGIVGCLALLRWAEAPGWSGWFYGAFVEPGRPYPGAGERSLTVGQYLVTLARHADPRGLPPFLILFAAAAAWTLVVRWRRLPRSSVHTRVLGVAWLGAVVFWLAYPRFADRFLVPWYILTVMCLLITWRDGVGGLSRGAESG